MARDEEKPARLKQCRQCGKWARQKGTTQSDAAFQCGPCYLQWKREQRKRSGTK